MQLYGELVDSFLEGLTVRRRQLVVELAPGVDAGLPGQLVEVHLAQLTEALVLGVQVFHRFSTAICLLFSSTMAGLQPWVKKL